MSAPSGRSERVYHQDYIARIRYENALPPPPGAPKLLDIPMQGLDYYTSAAFASRMARQQPLNIEADAELGMPIDLVGMPGIFDGDESSIQAPLSIPPVHPKDKPLLRPLSELGKMKYATGGHSFLRRTEYIATGDSRSRDGLSNRNLAKPSNKKRKQVDTSKDDPVNLLRATVKGFDIAYPKDQYKGLDGENNRIRGSEPTQAELLAWKNPKHPTNPELKVLDSYPLLPDLEAFPDSGAYQVVKFAANPIQPTEVRDTRMDVGLLNLADLTPQAQALVEEDYNNKFAAHKADPLRNPMPGPLFSYRFYLPQNEEGTRNIKRKLATSDSDNDGFEADSEQVRFDTLRIYDTSRSIMNGDFPYKEVALALHDPDVDEPAHASDSAHPEKAALYYPLGVKSQLKPRRNKNLAQLGLAGRNDEEDDDMIDGLYVSVREPTDAEKERREDHVREVESAFEGS